MFAIQHSDLNGWTRQLPATVNVKKHWSGKGSFEEAVNTLKGNVSYAIFYRHTSTFAHVSDFREHVDIDKTTNTPILNLEPSPNHVDSQAIVARVALWTAAGRINERLGLGFEGVLNPHRPPGMK